MRRVIELPTEVRHKVFQQSIVLLEHQEGRPMLLGWFYGFDLPLFVLPRNDGQAAGISRRFSLAPILQHKHIAIRIVFHSSIDFKMKQIRK